MSGSYLISISRWRSDEADVSLSLASVLGLLIRRLREF